MTHVADPGQGRRFSIGGDLVSVKVEGDATGDALSMIEYECPPGMPGPPLHVHRIVHEIWFILEGTVEFRVDHRTVRAGRGTTLHVSPGTAHSFTNVGEGTARWIGIFSPGRYVRLVEEIGKAFPPGGGPPDGGKVLAAGREWDMEIVEGG